MIKMLLAFLTTILITLLFSLTSESLIIMYLILLAQGYFICEVCRRPKKEQPKVKEEKKNNLNK